MHVHVHCKHIVQHYTTLNIACIIFHVAHSFIELITYLFEEGGAKSFLSERISQDPLKKFFGGQRQRGGVNENPSVHQFLQNNQSLRVVDSIKVDTSEGNPRGTNTSRSL